VGYGRCNIGLLGGFVAATEHHNQHIAPLLAFKAGN
jgi:hypothetical protein